MNLFADENIPLGSIKLLRKSGHNVSSVLEETPGAKDGDILKRACDENRTILTFDRDYGELIYRYKSYPPGGVVYFRFDPVTPEEPAEILLNILKNSHISIIGKFTVVERNRIRQRELR
jgi:predicted nuclease of predicted toxin-antitoxin system